MLSLWEMLQTEIFEKILLFKVQVILMDPLPLSPPYFQWCVKCQADGYHGNAALVGQKGVLIRRTNLEVVGSFAGI